MIWHFVNDARHKPNMTCCSRGMSHVTFCSHASVAPKQDGVSAIAAAQHLALWLKSLPGQHIKA